jgi:predicted kinase
VTIMRGASGAGKTHWHGIHLPNAYVCSADMYAYRQGKYEFVQAELAHNHKMCYLDFLNALHDKVLEIVVDNTNRTVFEIAPYYKAAEAFGYEVEIVWIITDPELCKEGNLHKTPHNKIDSFLTTVEPLPSWCNVRMVFRTKKSKNCWGVEE